MNDEKMWFNEVMRQNTEASIGKDYTRIILNFYFYKGKIFNTKIKLEEIYKFIYRFYIDNKEYSESNPSPLIRNIFHYRPIDLADYCNEQLQTWMNSGPSIIKKDNENIYIENIDFDKIKEKYFFIIKILVKKYMEKNFIYDDNEYLYNKEIITEDKYLKYMKNSLLRNRFFEIMNYCPLCDEIDYKKINVIHIKKILDSSEKEFFDFNNLVMLCDEHSKLYYDNYFKFQKNGHIKVLKKHISLDSRMHLNIELLNEERKKYISY